MNDDMLDMARKYAPIVGEAIGFHNVESRHSKESKATASSETKLIYKGPFREVLDDDGHRLERGRRYAVCGKTFQLYRKAPYQEHFEFTSRALKFR